MKYILVPTDFSDNSWNALAYSIQLFKNQACTFYMLHVGDLGDSAIHGNSFTLPLERISVSIKQKLKSLFDRIKELPINEEHHFIALQEYGNFIDIVRSTVAARKIDIIVMGTKGASGIKAAIVGSNTGDVITKVACTVLVIPENAIITIPKKIAFATDYTLFYTYPILATLTDILKISNSTLHVLNVSQPSTDLTLPQTQNKAYLKDYLDETFPHVHFFQNLSKHRKKASMLTYVSENGIDMLTVVAKNLNFFQRLLFDTTIKKLSFHTTVPLLVLHE